MCFQYYEFLYQCVMYYFSGEEFDTEFGTTGDIELTEIAAKVATSPTASLPSSSSKITIVDSSSSPSSLDDWEKWSEFEIDLVGGTEKVVGSNDV